MLPILFQSFLINLTALSLFYAMFWFFQYQRNLQHLGPIQLMHFSLQMSILSIFTAWILGFVGLMWALFFYIPLLIFTAGNAFVKVKNGQSTNGCVFGIPIVLFIFIQVSAFMGGLALRDWYIFQHECPAITAQELPQRTEKAFVITDAEPRLEYTGTHSWTTKDKEGKTTTHYAYYAPLVSASWTKAELVPAWVDVEDNKGQWVGRIIRDSASDKEWQAVRNAKLKYGISGVGEGEDTFRMVESDGELIHDVNFAKWFQLFFIGLLILFASIVLLWMRNEGSRQSSS